MGRQHFHWLPWCSITDICKPSIAHLVEGKGQVQQSIILNLFDLGIDVGLTFMSLGNRNEISIFVANMRGKRWADIPGDRSIIMSAHHPPSRISRQPVCSPRPFLPAALLALRSNSRSLSWTPSVTAHFRALRSPRGIFSIVLVSRRLH